MGTTESNTQKLTFMRFDEVEIVGSNSFYAIIVGVWLEFREWFKSDSVSYYSRFNSLSFKKIESWYIVF